MLSCRLSCIVASKKYASEGLAVFHKESVQCCFCWDNGVHLQLRGSCVVAARQLRSHGEAGGHAAGAKAGVVHWVGHCRRPGWVPLLHHDRLQDAPEKLSVRCVQKPQNCSGARDVRGHCPPEMRKSAMCYPQQDIELVLPNSRKLRAA